MQFSLMLLRLRKIECDRCVLQEFIFDGPCACPGGCDDNGVIGWWNKFLNWTKLLFCCVYCLLFILV